MNKQEAKQKLHNLAFAKMNARPDDLKLADVMQVIDQINEPQKVKIPKFVAEWIEYCKKRKLTLMGSFEPVSEHGIGLAETFKGNVLNCTFWASHNQEIFARAWLDGYEVEQEQLYIIPLKGLITTDGHQQYLTGKVGRYFASRRNYHLKQTFTQTELDNNVPACYREWAEPVEGE